MHQAFNHFKAFIFDEILILISEQFSSVHRWTYLVLEPERIPILRSNVPTERLVSAGKGFTMGQFIFLKYLSHSG